MVTMRCSGGEDAVAQLTKRVNPLTKSGCPDGSAYAPKSDIENRSQWDY